MPINIKQCTGCRNSRKSLQNYYMNRSRPLPLMNRPSIADGLIVPTVGCNDMATALPLIDKMVQVCTIIPLREY